MARDARFGRKFIVNIFGTQKVAYNNFNLWMEHRNKDQRNISHPAIVAL